MSALQKARSEAADQSHEKFKKKRIRRLQTASSALGGGDAARSGSDLFAAGPSEPRKSSASAGPMGKSVRASGADAEHALLGESQSNQSGTNENPNTSIN